MRVHGEKILSRRSLEQRKKYRDYLPELAEDFQYCCGYCGKSKAITKNMFEADHFIPRNIAPDKVNDYTNLVYSCWICNRKKGKKWPSGDPDVQFVNGKGFVDPATKEYDEHLERDDSGMIYGKTIAGKYMAEEVFEFNIRPLRDVWRGMKILECKKLLRQKKENATVENLQEYIELDEMLEAILNRLSVYKE